MMQRGAYALLLASRVCVIVLLLLSFRWPKPAMFAGMVGANSVTQWLQVRHPFAYPLSSDAHASLLLPSSYEILSPTPQQLNLIPVPYVYRYALSFVGWQ